MRLNLFIAKSGAASRRKADCLIKEGKVEVNGRKVCEPFCKVGEDDKVRVEGKLISLKTHVYILFNKPKGVTTTLGDKFARKKVVDFFPNNFFADDESVSDNKGIYPVGRLDKESRGLLILTNDGDLCYKLTHPKFFIEKEYLVKLGGVFKAGDCQKAKKGLRDEDDYLKVDSIEILLREKDETLCRVIVCEGKKRHLRRLFKGLGFSVRDLKRVRVGSLILGDLKPGRYKLINKNQISFC